MFFKQLKRFFNYIPLRPNFIWFAFFGGLAYYWLKENYVSTESSFGFLVTETGIIILYLAASLILISFLTTLFSYLYFLIFYRKQQAVIFLGKDIKEEAGWVPLEIRITGALRPFLGYIKADIVFNDLNATDSLVLNRSVKDVGKFFRKGISGIKQIWLPDRREYHVRESRLFFNDYFRMFSFTYALPFEKSFYTTPPAKKTDEQEATPNSSEDMTTRIPTMRRVEGDYLNYKNYESTDDPRRIVWKLYAKNKELVVKIPEVFNPFASHLYLLPSFYKQWKGPEKLEAELLNGYKDNLRLLTDSLLKQGTSLRIISDQEISTSFEVTDEEKILYQISTAHWQQEKTLQELIQPNSHTFICISSLLPAEMLENMPLLKQGAVLFYIKLSDTYRWAWLKKGLLSFGNIFFKLNDRTNQSLGLWWFSGFGRKVRNNERMIEKILAEQPITVIKI